MRSSLALLWLLAGCEATTCARHSDCAAGEVCMASGACAVAPDDGGIDAADASVLDAPADAAIDAPGDAP